MKPDSQTTITEGRACSILGHAATKQKRDDLRQLLPHVEIYNGPRRPIHRRYKLADVLELYADRGRQLREWRESIKAIGK